MPDPRETLINFVARGSDHDEWRMVLVEGPWLPPIEENLRRLQDRLYGCVDALLDGQLAEKFPETVGKRIVVQLDCYDLEEADVGPFFRRLSSGIFEVPDYRDALATSPFVRAISFEINFGNVG